MTDPKTPAEAKARAEAEARKTKGLVVAARRIIEELRAERQQNHFAPALAKAMERREPG